MASLTCTTDASNKCLFGRTNPFDTDFCVKELVGEGGFGKVYKCKSAIDGQWYAVKLEQFWFKPQAYFNPLDVRDVLMNEALALARLDHENVCRYFATWVQGSLIPVDTSASSTPKASDVVPSQHAAVRPLPLNSLEMSFSKSQNSDHDSSSLSADEGRFEMNDAELAEFEALGFEMGDSDSSRSSEPSPSPVVSGKAIEKRAKRDGASPLRLARPRGNSEATSNHGPLVTQIDVYIQMALYEGNTLQHWMEQRPSVDSVANLNVFRQILAGLKYIHKEKIIHRDIKPANIFLTSDSCVKIGDFGLAKNSLQTTLKLRQCGYLSSGEVDSDELRLELMDESTDGDDSFSAGVGTALYSSPEQAHGTSATTAATDIFSLGLVLCELFCKFTTQMERHVVLGRARTGELPASIVTNNPDIASLIRSMLHVDPACRPSCLDLEQYPVLQRHRSHKHVHFEMSAESETETPCNSKSNEKSDDFARVLHQLEKLEMQEAELLAHIATLAEQMNVGCVTHTEGQGSEHTTSVLLNLIAAARKAGDQRREILANALNNVS